MKKAQAPMPPASPSKPERAEPARGIECPKCGGRLFTCIYTRRKEHAIVRRKRCEQCGKRVLTREELQ